MVAADPDPAGRRAAAIPQSVSCSLTVYSRHPGASRSSGPTGSPSRGSRDPCRSTEAPLRGSPDPSGPDPSGGDWDATALGRGAGGQPPSHGGNGTGATPSRSTGVRPSRGQPSGAPPRVSSGPSGS